jgi:APA family basic amino acid/polyamine antiporter
LAWHYLTPLSLPPPSPQPPAGFTKANVANLHPFIPPEYGVRGIFNGASFVFFSFIGFDCVSTMAEEVKKPARDM